MKKCSVTARILWFSVMIISGSGMLYADSTSANSGSVEQNTAAVDTKKQLISAKRDYTVEKIRSDGSVTVKLGKRQKSVYLLFTNQGSEATTPIVSVLSESDTKAKGPKKSVAAVKSNEMNQPLHFANPHKLPEFEAFEKEIRKLLHTKPALKNSKAGRAAALESVSSLSMPSEGLPQEGDARIFSFDGTTAAHARKVIPNIETPMGTKSLVVWVSDNSFGEGCEKSRCVTQEMVDLLAPKFLQSGSDNDIYEWATAIYGEEWGNNAVEHFPNVIQETNEIHILLTDIEEDDHLVHGYIGMFGAKDLFKKSTVSSSNEETMFYIDAVMFANGSEEGWSIDDPMPMEIVSTLIHEFQHMIHIYQKTILLKDGVLTDSWIDEMLSLATEDIVAVKAQTKGPRDVSPDRGDAGDAGNTWSRYSTFNQNTTNPVTTMRYGLASYSSASAFGTYLTRNFGGAKLLHDIMHNSYTDRRAVEDAVNKNRREKGKEELTVGELIRKWGVAVLLSDHDDLHKKTPVYNSGDFFYSEYNDVDFLLGSINFYNYEPQPETFIQMQPIEPDANFYYKVGDDLSGEVQLEITKESDMDVTVIIK